jgi:SAM-dependent methyltransferase
MEKEMKQEERQSKWLKSIRSILEKRKTGVAEIEKRKIKLLGDLKGAVLEMRSSNGNNFKIYKTLQCPISNYTVLDPNIRLQRYLRNKAMKYSFEIHQVLTCEPEKIPLPDESFDCIVCSNFLDKVKSVDEVLREIKRLLKPGGKFYFLENICEDLTTQRVAHKQTWVDVQWDDDFLDTSMEHFSVRFVPYLYGSAKKAEKIQEDQASGKRASGRMKSPKAKHRSDILDATEVPNLNIYIQIAQQ